MIDYSGQILSIGSHTDPTEGMSLLEAVSYVAGEPFTNNPQCVSPFLSSLGRALNDMLPNKERQQLVPLILGLIGTNDEVADQLDGLKCAHWFVSKWAPAWFDLIPGLEAYSTKLRELPLPLSWTDSTYWTVATKIGWEVSLGALSIGEGLITPQNAVDEASEAAWDLVRASVGSAIAEAAWDVAWSNTRVHPEPWGSTWNILWTAVHICASQISDKTNTPASSPQDAIDFYTDLVQSRPSNVESHLKDIQPPISDVLAAQPLNMTWYYQAKVNDTGEVRCFSDTGSFSINFDSIVELDGFIDMLTKENVEFTLVYQSGGKVVLQNHKE